MCSVSAVRSLSLDGQKCSCSAESIWCNFSLLQNWCDSHWFKLTGEWTFICNSSSFHMFIFAICWVYPLYSHNLNIYIFLNCRFPLNLKAVPSTSRSADPASYYKTLENTNFSFRSIRLLPVKCQFVQDFPWRCAASVSHCWLTLWFNPCSALWLTHKLLVTWIWYEVGWLDKTSSFHKAIYQNLSPFTLHCSQINTITGANS